MSVSGDYPILSRGLSFQSATMTADDASETTDDLEVTVDLTGIAMAGPSVGRRQLLWSDLTGPRFGGDYPLPDGREGTVLSAVFEGRRLYWVVPRQQIDQSLVVVVDFELLHLSANPVPPAAPAPLAPALTFGQRRYLVAALIIAALILAIVLPISLLGNTATPKHHSTQADIGGSKHSGRSKLTTRQQLDHLAAQLNVTRANLPTGWFVDASGDGPLSGVNSSSVSSFTGTQGLIVNRFERCMGITRKQDRVFGEAVAKPIGSSTSPTFAGPSGSEASEIVGQTAIYDSASVVSADSRFVDRIKFASCFGTAFGQFFTGGLTKAAASAVTVGTVLAEATPDLPQKPHVTATGVEVEIPVQVSNNHTFFQLGFIFVAAGKAEATLYTYSAALPFSSAVTDQLVAALETNVGVLAHPPKGGVKGA